MGKPGVIEMFEELLWFLREYADERHHAKEEGLLFPAMEVNGLPVREGPAVAMRLEHQVGRGLIAEMDAALGHDRARPISWDRFVAAAEAYVDLLRLHIEKENHCIFAIANAIVSSTELDQLADAFGRMDAAWYGPRSAGRGERVEALFEACRSLCEDGLAGLRPMKRGRSKIPG